MGEAALRDDSHLRQIWTPETERVKLELLKPGNLKRTKKAIHRLSTVAWNGKYIPNRPHPKQLAFLLMPHEEVLYGGAAGGGKSDALLMAALQYVHIPEYRALILRRTYKQLALPNAIMDRAKTWMRGTDAIWQEGKKTFTFPSGARLVFGHLAIDSHVQVYQGSEFQFIGFDELTQFTAYQYSYMFSRLRRLSGFQVPLRMRAATNPGGPGHAWVKDRFVRPRTSARPFVPARLTDNPGLDIEAYRDSLSRLHDRATRRQLEFGEWDILTGGNYFERDDFIIDPLRVIPRSTVRWIRFWDLAGTEPSEETPDPDFTAGVLIGFDGERVYIKDVKHARMTPKKVERMIAKTAKRDGDEVTIWMEQEPGASGKSLISHYRRNVLKGYIVRGFKPKKDKEGRARFLSAAVEDGDVVLVGEGWDKNSFIDECVLFPSKGAHDDRVDAASAGYMILTGKGRAEDSSGFKSTSY